MTSCPHRFRVGLALCCITVFAQVAPANGSFAQQVTRSGGSWISAGIGGGLFAGTEGLGLQLQTAHQRGKHLYSIRGAVVAEILGDAVYDLGVLYGRAWAEGRTFLSLSSGVGLVVTEECPGLFTGGSCRTRHALGLPVSAEVFGRLTHFFGIGFQLFANVNSSQSFFGGLVGVQVGSLGSRK